MPVRFLIRRSAALGAAPILIVLVLLYQTVGSDTAIGDRWRWSESSAPVVSLFLITTICATCAAWESGRLRRGAATTWTPSRSRMRLMADALTPVILLGVIGYMVATIAIGPSVWPDPRPFLTSLASIVGMSVVGFALGWRFKPTVAVPAALLGTYLWMVYPAAVEPLWLRHLTGTSWDECCAIDQVPTPALAVASPLFYAGLIAVATIWLAERPTGRGRAVAAGAGIVCLVSAVFLVHDLNAIPVQARTMAMTCDGAAPRVCVWPEHRGLLRAGVGLARGVTVSLASAGLAVPSTVTERRSAEYGAGWGVTLFTGMTAPELRKALIIGFVPDGAPPCADTMAFSDEALDPITAWVGLAAGLDRSMLAEMGLPEDAITLAEAVRRLPQRAQLDWYARNRASLVDCRVQPDLAVSR